MDIKTQLKQSLLNQKQIMTNQSLILKEIASRYNPDANEANSLHCTKIILRIQQTENSIHATQTIIGEID